MRPYRDWLKVAAKTWREKQLAAGLFEFYSIPYQYVISRLSGTFLEPSGEPIYDADWDLLVIVDACRADLMADVLGSGDYEFVSTTGSTRSTGSNTYQWMNANFRDEFAVDMAETVYVCGNPFSDSLLDPDDFRELVEVWRYAWNESVGTLPPRPVTDEAIRQHRRMDDGRLLVHYMQPHCPFLSMSDRSGGKTLDTWPESPDGDVWTELSHGEIDPETVWDHYRQNLELVLGEVDLLLENVSAERAILASDHGNAFGEYGIYGHPRGMPFEAVRQVPWTGVKTGGDGSYAPGDREEPAVESDVEDRLRSLGYRR